MRHDEEVVMWGEKKKETVKDFHHHNGFGVVTDVLIVVGIGVIIFLLVKILRRR